MFKQILKANDLRKIISLKPGLCYLSYSMSDEQEQHVRRRIGLKERSMDSFWTEFDNFRELKRDTLKKTNRLAHQDDLIKSLYYCKSVEHLLTLVRPYLVNDSSIDSDAPKSLPRNENRIEPDHLEMVYNQFRLLYHEPKFGSKQSLDKFCQTLKESSEFECLQHQTVHLIEELSTACLIDALYAFTRILNQDPQSKFVRGVIKQLDARLNVLTLDETADCLEILNRYQINSFERNPTELNQDLPQFTRSLAEAAKRRLMSNHSGELQTILRYFFIFLNPHNDPTYKMVINLAKRLCSPDVKFDFKQSVMLLRIIKINHLFMEESKACVQDKLFIELMNKLISKCNSSIFDTLNSERKPKDFDFYLMKIHDFINPINYDFSNFYDKRLIRLLGDFLIEHLDDAENYKHLLYNLVYNYSKFFTFDERLLKLLYELCCENERLVPKIAVSNFYYLFSRYRLPFVDHERLATKLLLNASDYETMDYYKRNPLKVLCQLILNDVADQRLLIYFDAAADKLDDAFYARISFNQYKEIALARVHLKASKTHETLKRQIEQKLDRAVKNIIQMNRRPRISDAFIRINNKLQSNAYLSNGVFIYPVGIYDRNIQNLIALPHLSFFQEIDRLPLTDNQEM